MNPKSDEPGVAIPAHHFPKGHDHLSSDREGPIYLNPDASLNNFALAQANAEKHLRELAKSNPHAALANRLLHDMARGFEIILGSSGGGRS